MAGAGGKGAGQGAVEKELGDEHARRNRLAGQLSWDGSIKPVDYWIAELLRARKESAARLHQLQAYRRVAIATISGQLTVDDKGSGIAQNLTMRFARTKGQDLVLLALDMCQKASHKNTQGDQVSTPQQKQARQKQQ